MLKKILLISVSALLFAYLAFAYFYFGKKEEDTVCKDVRIIVKDSTEKNFINEKEISLFLKKKNLFPIGKNMDEINTGKIEKDLLEIRLIKEVESYKTVGGTLVIELYQKIPILRVFAYDKTYFVDSEGKMMPVPPGFSAYVPVASGSINTKYATTQLYNFARFINSDPFWNSQIEQIYVTPDQDIELIPRIGNEKIILGKIDNYKENLNKLRVFYEKGLNIVGWNKYSTINLKFKNQVVCTKK